MAVTKRPETNWINIALFGAGSAEEQSGLRGGSCPGRVPRGCDLSQQIEHNLKSMAEEIQPHVLEKFTLLKKVGSGAYGHVWKVTNRRTGAMLALKKIFDAFQHSVDAQRTYREIVYLHELDHPNVVKLHQVIRAENDKDLYLVFEFMEADLHNAISQRILKDIHNRFIMHQILKAVNHLHSVEIIHRDLKPSNILLNADCHLKICDFGLARSLLSDGEVSDVVLTEEVATRWYRAPEVLLGSQVYEKSADVWSVGCILAEMLLGKPLFPGASTLNQLERILSFTGKPSKEDVDSLKSEMAVTMMGSVNFKARSLAELFRFDTPSAAIELVTRMLQFNPLKRITMQEALNHPYVVQFKSEREGPIPKPICAPVSDNKKLSLKQYKQLIYERVKKLYGDREKRGSLHRNSLSESREKSLKEARNSLNNFRSSKIIPSASAKCNSQSYSSVNSYSYVRANEEERGVKRKQSLKDILSNKRPLSRPDSRVEARTGLLANKYQKSTTLIANAKENRTFIYSDHRF